MTGQGKGVKQPLACWVTRHNDLKQRVGVFFLGCPFSKASFMRLSPATVHRTTKPWRGGQGDTPMATILVIDEEEPIRALLRIALEGAGHEVLEASNGRRGLALYRARAADLIITDLVMPEVDGLEMMLELTRNFLNVKVIALSAGLEGEASLHVAKLLGARQTIQKPFDMETVLSAVRYELAY
jgi:two-component system response regulator (stage 0 sporulation protein F)